MQAGWDFAVGALLSTNAMPRVSNIPNVADDAESVASFFGNVCAARGSTLALNAPVVNANGTGTQWPELCGGCQVMILEIIAGQTYSYAPFYCC